MATYQKHNLMHLRLGSSLLSAIFVVLIGCRSNLKINVDEENTKKGDPSEIEYTPGSKVVVSGADAEHSNLSESNDFYAVATLDPSQVCNDIEYYNSEGEWVSGTRDCTEIVDDPNLKPEHIKEGIEIAGVRGTMIAAPAECSTDGEISCLSTESTPAAAIAGAADKILATQSLAGVIGNVTLPSTGKVLSGTNYGVGGVGLSGVFTLPLASNVLLGSGSFGDPNAPITPSYTPDFPAVANVRSNDTVNGANGTLVNCTSDGEISCISTSSFKAADMSLATAGNIRSGVTIAGQSGDYPSSTYPLPSASATADLNSTDFESQVISSTAFEYWSSDGSYHSGAGDSDITPSKILSGVTIFGESGSLPLRVNCEYGTQAACDADNVCAWNTDDSYCELKSINIRAGVSLVGKAGSLKLNCRNRANSSLYNADSMPPGTAATTTGTTVDWWDTTENSNNNANTLPTELPADWSADEHMCGKELWSDLTSDGACDSAADDCMMKDTVTGLIWSESYPVSGADPAVTTLTWPQAIEHCHNLNYGSRTDWRLPTQMELQIAYTHGIRELGYKGAGTIRPSGDTLDNNDFFVSNIDSNVWSASTKSNAYWGWSWSLHLNSGFTTTPGRGDSSATVLCVVD